MPTHKELLLSLREDFEGLKPFGNSELKTLQERGEMIIERVFGKGSRYVERFSAIQFHYRGPIAISSSGESAAQGKAQRNSRINSWVSGQQQVLGLIDVMVEDLELGETENLQSEEDINTPKSGRVFVVHGHNNEMRESVARMLSKLGLEPVILHEQADRGRTIIEKFYEQSDIGFAVVLLSPDDTGYSNINESDSAKPRARQKVLLELGFFLGRLGRENVIALHQGEVEIPSDFSGVLYTPYDNDRAWQYKLTKELRESGYHVSADDL